MNQPSSSNDFCCGHVALLEQSLQHWRGRGIFSGSPPAEFARAVFESPAVIVSHDTQEEPVFTYGNLTALELFEMPWQEFTALPSKKSALPDAQRQREELLREVKVQGYSERYSGVRVSKSGRVFRIDQAVVWNLVNEQSELLGQAAMFSQWEFL